MGETKITCKLKSHSIYLLLTLLLVFLVYSNWLNFSSLPALDHVTFYYPREQFMKESWDKYKDVMPLWAPYWNSGTPFFAKPGYPGFAYPLSWLIFFFSPLVAYKLNIFIDLVFAAVSMYILMIYFFKNRKAAFFSALVFVFNGWTISKSINGHLTSLNAIPYIPLIFLFTLKAYKEKEWLRNSVIVGILFALQIIAGPDLKIFLFTAPIFALYSLFFLIGPNIKKRAVKTFLITFFVLITMFGLAMFKILPEKEYLDLTSRADLDFESSSKNKLRTGTAFSKLIEPIYEGFPKIRREGGSWSAHVGIIAFLLAAFYCYKNIKKRYVLFFISSIIISILLAGGTFLFYLLWKYVPPYDSFRFLDRALILYVFSISILAGVGATSFSNYIAGKFKAKENYIFIGLSILLLINLAAFGELPWPKEQSNVQDTLDNNYVLNYLSKQPGIFRINAYETKGIDWGTEFYNVPLGLQGIFGYEGAWLTDYLNIYLSVAWNNPAKFWGTLNLKYLTSQEKIDLAGFRFIEEFDNCTVCFPSAPQFAKAWGPYLYENKLFLPRAYVVPNSILVVGDEDPAKQAMYGLMLDDNFNPANTVIVMGEKGIIDNYGLDFLKRFDAVFLTQGSVGQNSYFILKQYSDSGGILLPDVINGKNSITSEDITSMLSSFKGTYEEANRIKTIDFDNYLVEFDMPKTGFLVYSEKFSMFPGWKAVFDSREEDVLRADGVITAVYIDDEQNVLFSYSPSSFRKGAIISITALILVIGYFAYRKTKKFRKP